MDKVKNITLREKAAIIYSIITGINDNVTFYSIAKGKEKNINRESYSSMGLLLKKKDHIKLYYSEAQNIINKYITTVVKENSFVDNDGDSITFKNINFTDPNEFISYLNNQANLLQNEKDKREYLKLLADLLRFKDNTGDGQTEIQRFYTPENCQNCAIYQAQKRKITG